VTLRDTALAIGWSCLPIAADGFCVSVNASILKARVEMLFAHVQRIPKLDQLRLRGPNGAHGEFLAATAQNYDEW